MLCPHCMKQIDDNSEYCSFCGEKVLIQNAEHELPVGSMLSNRYYIGSVLGSGGFGITYVGCDTKLNKKVAIKEYYPGALVNRVSQHSTNLSVSAGEDAALYEHEKQKFIKEAYLLAQFSDDQNVVNVTDVIAEHNTAYLVMEFVEGDTLEKYIKQHGKMSFNEVFGILKPMMDSLSKIHASGLIHRDISPANIMLRSDMKVTLIDFGAAREFDSNNEKSLSVILKHGYAPTEQYQTKGIQGPWTDVYAVCATIYKAITGITPPNAIDRMVGDIMKKPSALGANITRRQETALMKGLAITQADRFSSMAELVDALSGKKTSRNTRKELSLSENILGVVAAVLLVAAIGSIIYKVVKPTLNERVYEESVYNVKTADDLEDPNKALEEDPETRGVDLAKVGEGLLIDGTGTLTQDQLSELESLLEEYKAERSVSLHVILSDKLNEDNKAFNSWAMGLLDAGVDHTENGGILLAVGLESQEWRTVYKGLVDDPTIDEKLKNLMDNRIMDMLKNGNSVEALNLYISSTKSYVNFLLDGPTDLFPAPTVYEGMPLIEDQTGELSPQNLAAIEERLEQYYIEKWVYLPIVLTNERSAEERNKYAEDKTWDYIDQKGYAGGNGIYLISINKDGKTINWKGKKYGTVKELVTSEEFDTIIDKATPAFDTSAADGVNKYIDLIEELLNKGLE